MTATGGAERNRALHALLRRQREQIRQHDSTFARPFGATVPFAVEHRWLLQSRRLWPEVITTPRVVVLRMPTTPLARLLDAARQVTAGLEVCRMVPDLDNDRFALGSSPTVQLCPSGRPDGLDEPFPLTGQQMRLLAWRLGRGSAVAVAGSALLFSRNDVAEVARRVARATLGCSVEVDPVGVGDVLYWQYWANRDRQGDPVELGPQWRPPHVPWLPRPEEPVRPAVESAERPVAESDWASIIAATAWLLRRYGSVQPVPIGAVCRESSVSDVLGESGLSTAICCSVEPGDRPVELAERIKAGRTAPDGNVRYISLSDLATARDCAPPTSSLTPIGVDSVDVSSPEGVAAELELLPERFGRWEVEIVLLSGAHGDRIRLLRTSGLVGEQEAAGLLDMATEILREASVPCSDIALPHGGDLQERPAVVTGGETAAAWPAEAIAVSESDWDETAATVWDLLCDGKSACLESKPQAPCGLTEPALLTPVAGATSASITTELSRLRLAAERLVLHWDLVDTDVVATVPVWHNEDWLVMWLACQLVGARVYDLGIHVGQPQRVFTELHRGRATVAVLPSELLEAIPAHRLRLRVLEATVDDNGSHRRRWWPPGRPDLFAAVCPAATVLEPVAPERPLGVEGLVTLPGGRGCLPTGLRLGPDEPVEPVDVLVDLELNWSVARSSRVRWREGIPVSLPAVAAAVGAGCGGRATVVRCASGELAIGVWPADGGEPISADLLDCAVAKLPPPLRPPSQLQFRLTGLKSADELRAMADRAVARRARTLEPPANHTEHRLAEAVFGPVLQLHDPDRHESLFTSGATSLQLLGVRAAIRELWGVEVPMAEVFSRPTLAGLGELVDEAIHTSGEVEAAIEDVLGGVVGQRIDGSREEDR